LRSGKFPNNRALAPPGANDQNFHSPRLNQECGWLTSTAFPCKHGAVRQMNWIANLKRTLQRAGAVGPIQSFGTRSPSISIPGWRPAAVALALFTGCAQTQQHRQIDSLLLPREQATQPTSLAMPDGVNVFKSAKSIGSLERETRPDLMWLADDGNPILVWVKHRLHKDNWEFTASEAYLLTRSDQASWCLLDFPTNRQVEPQSAAWKFMNQKFIRQTVFSTNPDRPDGNVSYVELLSTDSNGARLFKLVYSSTGGFRAQQEWVRTILIYMTPQGKPCLAASDIGHEGAYPHGSLCRDDYFEFSVKWRRSKSVSGAPFDIAVRQVLNCSYCGEEADSFGYTTIRDGQLSGPLPQVLKLSSTQHVEADGKESLTSLAKTLMRYNSTWSHCDWIPREQQPHATAQILAKWLGELKSLNPNVDPQEVIAKGAPIIIPDESQFDSSVYTEIAAQFVR
jgi:hypothetical protein